MIHDPFEEPGTMDGPEVGSASQRTAISPLPTSDATKPASPPNAELPPLVVSDEAESADDWLAQAQSLAQSAETVDELSAVINFCQRGLADGPIAELASPLRRLAAWAHNRRGELMIDDDRQQEAIRDFQIAISLNPFCSLAIHNRAVTLAQQNQSTAALRDFNRVIELNPGLAIAYRNRAELLASLGRISEAVRDYSRAIEGLPDNAELYRGRGSAWHRIGEYERALDDLNLAIHLAPEDPDALTQRGNLEAERGNFDSALGDFRQALSVDPEWAEAHRSLAWLQATCPNSDYRDVKQALAAAKQAQRLAPPNDCFVLDALAAAHASAGEFDEAVRIQRQAIAASSPDFVEPMRQRLALYQQSQPFLNEPVSAVRAASHESSSRKVE